MTYKAIICEIKTRPHPNADKLQLADANGFQVVVGLDNYDGQLGIFFPTDGQLSEEYCKEHDLVGYSEQLEDGTKVKRGGYFPASRRVRAQRFRGERSDGYWAPIDTLEFTGFDVASLVVGDQIDSLNGVPLCNKY